MRIIILLLALIPLLFLSSETYAEDCKNVGSCSGAGPKYEKCDRCAKPEPNSNPGPPCNCTQCKPAIQSNHRQIRAHMTDEFIKHRNWMIDVFFTQHILPAMMLMTSQLSTASVQQTQMIGAFFDAKHQLETQRLFQQLMAEAHKDYQPSEGLCEIGTNTRSLAASGRKSDLGHVAFANRVIARELRTKDVLSAAEENSDIDSRLKLFIEKHCHKVDNANGLNLLCKDGTAPKEQRNQDVDFTRAVESKLTLDIDFTKDGEEVTPDEEDIFALTANLFAHEPLPIITNRLLADGNGNPRVEAHRYMNLRSVAAKRSVAQNSFTALVAERAKGSNEEEEGEEGKKAASYLKKLVAELGIANEDVEEILGEDPSYFAQMEVLTKKIYQNPVFYTELYDKPANVTRKGATIRAISLMQDRDIYESLLRSEAVLSVLLETMLHPETERVYRQLNELEPDGEPVTK